MSIVTRADKGSKLTWDEMDNNFTENDTVDVIDNDYILKVPIDTGGDEPQPQGAITIQKFETDSKLYGNERGNGAVDLQCNRYDATQVASGEFSVAMGSCNTVSGFASTSMGNNNTVSGEFSVAFGYNNTVENDYSTSMGNNNTVENNYSVAMGEGNTASGADSIAMGESNTASGYYSVAMGSYNTASGTGSIAMGGYNTASGTGSIAMGYGAKNIQTISTMVGLGLASDYTDIISSTNEYVDAVKTTDETVTDTQNPIMLKPKSVVYAKLRLIAVSNSMDKWIADITHTITTQADGTVSATTTKTDIIKDVSDWDISFTEVSDTNNPKLKCTVTGVADVTIGWGLSGSISETFNYHIGS